MSKIGKIVELLIDWDEEQFADLGVDIMSLVESPAIGINWQAFSEEELDEECPIIAMASSADFGEVLDYNYTVEINQTEAGFSTLQDTLKAIIGLDILGKKNPKDEGEVKYRYAGPSAEREMCKSLLRLGKVYTDKEIERLTTINGDDAYHSDSSDNFFKYKSGVNCRHYWEQVRLFREGMKTVVVSEGRAPGIAGRSMESQPRGGRFMSQWSFSDDDQMIITGPSMTPDILIPRKNEDGSVFHVYFTKETIEKISRKFLEENKQHQTDINHDDSITSENTLLESWIVTDPEMDKSKSMGFDVPVGTWMVSYKINNEDTWNKIKNKELNGFSITGSFIEKAYKK